LRDLGVADPQPERLDAAIVRAGAGASASLVTVSAAGRPCPTASPHCCAPPTRPRRDSSWRKLQKGYEGGVPALHNPLGGGAPPAYSALTLRRVLAIFGLVSSVGLAAAWIVGLLWLAVVLTVLAMIVAIDIFVIMHRKRPR
jgi:hypothetical protein